MAAVRMTQCSAKAFFYFRPWNMQSGRSLSPGLKRAWNRDNGKENGNYYNGLYKGLYRVLYNIEKYQWHATLIVGIATPSAFCKHSRHLFVVAAATVAAAVVVPIGDLSIEYTLQNTTVLIIGTSRMVPPILRGHDVLQPCFHQQSSCCCL